MNIWYISVTVSKQHTYFCLFLPNVARLVHFFLQKNLFLYIFTVILFINTSWSVFFPKWKYIFKKPSPVIVSIKGVLIIEAAPVSMPCCLPSLLTKANQVSRTGEAPHGSHVYIHNKTIQWETRKKSCSIINK